MIKRCTLSTRPQCHRNLPADDLSGARHSGGQQVIESARTAHDDGARVGGLTLSQDDTPQRAQGGWRKALDPEAPLSVILIHPDAPV